MCLLCNSPVAESPRADHPLFRTSPPHVDLAGGWFFWLGMSFNSVRLDWDSPSVSVSGSMGGDDDTG